VFLNFPVSGSLSQWNCLDAIPIGSRSFHWSGEGGQFLLTQPFNGFCSKVLPIE
jgi:hypothetical protein